MGSLVHDIIYVEKYTLEIAHEKIYEDRIGITLGIYEWLEFFFRNPHF